GKYDLVSWVIMWKSEYAANGLLAPLSQFFADTALVDPDYALEEIAGAYLVSGGVVGGKKGYLDGRGASLYGVPYGAETSMLAYRKDILEENNIRVPETYQDLRNAIERLSALGIPAMTSRGQGGNDVTFAWLLHLGPLGGKIFDDQWKPQINSPAAVEAAEFLRLVVETGPADIESFNFGQSAFEFLSGGAAMYLDNIKIAGAARDPNFSSLNDKIGYIPHPKGATCSAETGGFAIGIPANSQNQKAAFLLLQYLTSKAGDQRIVDLGGDPIRIPTLFANRTTRPEFDAVIGSLSCANEDWRPLIPEWNSIQNDILGPALLEVTRSDRPVQQIMDDANDQLRGLMDQAGYYLWNTKAATQ
ncbi:MAG: extracellular solute-binding protein, partial [Pseudomonadota bacterium]